MVSHPKSTKDDDDLESAVSLVSLSEQTDVTTPKKARTKKRSKAKRSKHTKDGQHKLSSDEMRPDEESDVDHGTVAVDTATAVSSNPGSGEANPFAPRDGKKLSWTNVNMTLKKPLKKGGVMTKKILDSVWGEVPCEEITAIMGPSGGGKTSLLNVLAGRASSKGHITIESTITVDGYAIDPTKIEIRKKIAFVAQEESLPITSTPREAIAFSARLRLPRYTTQSNIENLTSIMLTELGLDKCADTIIGGGLIKGISGGQKKRASVGVELVVKPSMVFLDEPTSGLDSYSAAQLVKVLKKVAHAGASVLFTIHQPPSAVFATFDRLLLLNTGRVMYSGSVAGIPEFFARCNSPVPQHFNPADWIIQAAEAKPLEQLEQDGFFPKDTRVNIEKKLTLADKIRESLGFLGDQPDSNLEKGADDRHVSFQIEVFTLMKREFKGFYRNKFALAARFVVSLVVGVLTGVIFWGVGTKDPLNPAYLQSQFGGIILVLMESMICTAQSTLLEFPAERPIFVREYSTDHYSVTSYFINRLFIEGLVTFVQVFILTFLNYTLMQLKMSFMTFFMVNYGLAMGGSAIAVIMGCTITDGNVAQQMLPIVFVPQLLFAGFFVVTELIPVYLRWVQYFCNLTYAIRIVLQAEMGSCTGIAQYTCNAVLEQVGVDGSQLWLYWLVLVSLFCVCRLIALALLKRKATEFF